MADELNDNVLEGMKCPLCGSQGPFMIESTTTAKVYDSGVEDTYDMNWGPESACSCCECDHDATVEDFTEKPLQKYTVYLLTPSLSWEEVEARSPEDAIKQCQEGDSQVDRFLQDMDGPVAWRCSLEQPDEEEEG
jgi:hypothetical protein